MIKSVESWLCHWAMQGRGGRAVKRLFPGTRSAVIKTDHRDLIDDDSSFAGMKQVTNLFAVTWGKKCTKLTYACRQNVSAEYRKRQLASVG